VRRIAYTAATASAIALLVAGLIALRCQLGIHGRRVMQFVGSSEQPDLYVRICNSCLREV
jgi:hypothetical protein